MRKIIGPFLSDQKGSLCVYFGNTFFIALFYSLTFHSSVELAYPFLLSAFLYIIYLLYQFYHYYMFHKTLESMVKYKEIPKSFSSYQYKEVKQALSQVHMNYIDQIQTTELAEVRKRRFLSAWIHNMKTPVTVSNLLLQRLENEEIEPERFLVSMKEENEKLTHELDMVLNMLRLKEFEKDYLPVSMNLTEQVTGIINQNKKLFIYSHVYPKFEQSNQPVYVLSDAKWNGFLLTQLISNAVKYSKEKDTAKYLHFSITRQEHSVMLKIRDEGIGIPECDAKRVFEPFFTGENGRKVDSSSGIGLYFCKEICDMLGHTIEITSEVGKGTTVTITYLSRL